MTELADRLSRHADLHEHQPWADDEQMQFARDLREAVGLIAELARLRAQVPVGWIGPSGFTHNTATNRMWMRESPKLAAKLSPVYAAPPAQPAEQQAQTVCKRTLVEIDARLRECSIVGASAADAYDTFYQHMVETALAAQPAEPVQPGWRDIESAPKDGRVVLLGKFNSHNKWRTMRGQWFSADAIAETWEDPDDAPEGWHETSVEAEDMPNVWYTEPTHWMPLPPAPKATK